MARFVKGDFKPVEARLWPKVFKTDTCWLWTGAKTKGYGTIFVQGKAKYTHRVVYELLRGAVPDDKEMDHKCRVPSCCNPEQLEIVDQIENIARGAFYRRRTHCKRGHPLSGDNLYEYLDKSKGRMRKSCKACNLLFTHRKRKKLTDADLVAIKTIDERMRRVGGVHPAHLPIAESKQCTREAAVHKDGDLRTDFERGAEAVSE